MAELGMDGEWSDLREKTVVVRVRLGTGENVRKKSAAPAVEPLAGRERVAKCDVRSSRKLDRLVLRDQPLGCQRLDLKVEPLEVRDDNRNPGLHVLFENRDGMGERRPGRAIGGR